MNLALPVDALLAGALASLRMAALFTTAPLFGQVVVPIRVRVSLAVLVAWLVAPQPVGGWDPLLEGAVPFFAAAVAEVAVGLTLGFATHLVFAAFSLFGEFVSVQVGLGHARVLDPTTGSSSVALAALFDVFVLLIYLAIDGHHALLHSAVLSFQALPLAGGGPGAEVFAGLASMASSLFEIAMRLAAPITVAMLVSNTALGVLARSVPQLNLMMLQLPAHVALGLGAGGFVSGATRELERWSGRVLQLFAGGA